MTIARTSRVLRVFMPITIAFFSASLTAYALLFVHLAGIGLQIHFVYLYGIFRRAADLAGIVIAHDFADPVEHEPCALLGYADRPASS